MYRIMKNYILLAKYYILIPISVFIIMLLSTYNIYASNLSLNTTCAEIQNVCLEPAETRNIDGLEVYRECWKYQIEYKCKKDTFIDYCIGIKNTAGCELISSNCLEREEAYDNTTEQNLNICVNEKNIYQCGNLLNNAISTTNLDIEYTIIDNSKNINLNLPKCSINQLQSQENCYKIGTICMEPAGTKNINGIDIYKNCWKYEDKYACVNSSYITECAYLENDSNCSLKNTQCLSPDQTNCNHYSREYSCKIEEIKNNSGLLCNSSIYCIDGDCENPTLEQDKDFSKAISSLLAVNEVAKDLDKDTLTVFKAQSLYCDKAIVGFNNCCSDGGWGQNLKLDSCDSNEKLLAEKQKENLCHYVGTYCSEKEKITNICLKKRNVSCCFDSKLSRIIHEQGRAQLGINWGTPQLPNCQSLTIEQIQQIDFSKIDFSEIYEDINANITIPNPEELGDQIKKEVNNYYEN